jgi:hypothetical protein
VTTALFETVKSSPAGRAGSIEIDVKARGSDTQIYEECGCAGNLSGEMENSPVSASQSISGMETRTFPVDRTRKTTKD